MRPKPLCPWPLATALDKTGGLKKTTASNSIKVEPEQKAVKFIEAFGNAVVVLLV